VIGADAAAVNDQRTTSVLGLHEREYFLKDVALILVVPLDPGRGRYRPAVEAFRVDAVDAEKTDVSGVDGMTERMHKSPVFVVVKATFTGGEYENLGARMPEHEHLHFTVEPVAIPLLILALHLLQRTVTTVPKILLHG
jgi:hypothetical protein